VIYFLVIGAVALPLLILGFLHERRWRRRELAIRALLDGADELEQQLQQCRVNMQELRGMLVDLPEEMSADADFALAADDKVQAALRDLLQHRLWIKQHAADADQAELDQAVNALSLSRQSMAQQLDRLANITRELREAQGR
jgi:hypothetical protein